MKMENVVPDLHQMMAEKIAYHMPVEDMRDYFGDDLEPNMLDGDVRKFFQEWLMNDAPDKIPELYTKYVESPVIEETAVIRTQTVDLPVLGVSAVVETRMTRVGGMEDNERVVVNIEIDGTEYEVDSDVEDVILDLL